MRVDYVCETCGKTGHRIYPNDKIPGHFFCSRECQNVWQKTREDLVIKNKNPAFRKKVSEGLKRRKQKLGDDYHSPETKRKIGEATIKHWNGYSEDTKQRMLDVLYQNAQNHRTHGAYDLDWKRLSAELRAGNYCHRCGKTERLAVHHIIPVSQGGTREEKNLVVLCPGCHTTVENLEKKVFEIMPSQTENSTMS